MKDAEEEKEEKSGAIGTIARTHVGLEDNHSTASSFAVALGNSSWSDLPSPSSWNIDILVDSIKQLAPGINWLSVIESLDHEGFYLPNEEAFSFFMSVYRCACQDPFPLKAICGSVWKNIEGQISFLKYAVSAPPEAFTFAHSARQLTVYNLLQSEVSLAVFPMIMKNAGGVGMILYLWHVNPILVLRGFVDAAGLDPDCMTRILDICEELKVRDSRKFLLIHPLGFFYALYCSDTPTLLVFVFSPLNG
ncbi:uncharacterized protein LOC115684386 isoform X3 [Syzygium oleosum]|uniref:uncharacterized protein LOC115684386 isoform X3 n=1 Tax=Syzygium oleosum TaxID=219896 RepID=UPI0024BAB1DC|nr:uncharacterized protein LOC115684386 isoform X3 [Syzygium oleosum]